MSKHKSKLVFFIILILFFSCGENKEKTKDASSLAKTEETSKEKIPVKIKEVNVENFIEKIKASGTISAWYDVTLSSETSGRIEKINAKVGDWLKKGEVIIKVDDQLKKLAYDQASAQLKAAQASYEKALEDFRRFQKLFEEKDISEYEFETARLQKETAQANFDLAKAQAEMAKRGWEDTQIKSPISGQLAKKYVEVGELLSPGMPVATIVNIEKVKINLGLSERDIVKIKRGQTAEIDVDVLPKELFYGKVTAVGIKADLKTRTFPVEITIPNQKRKLKPGMVAKMKIHSRTLEDVIKIPEEVIVKEQGKTFVFVINQGVAHKKEVSGEVKFEDKMVITSGLEKGEKLVIEGQNNLKDKDSVIIEVSEKVK